MSNPVTLLGATLAYVALMPSDVVPHSHPAKKADLQQFDEAIRQIEQRCGRPLSKDERRRVHDAITGQGWGIPTIVEVGVGLYCPGR